MRAFLLAAAMLAGLAVGADVKAGVDSWAKGDYTAAIAAWRGPATAGDADAQFNLAQAYKLGRGVPADMPVAMEWFRKAAAQGHAQAIDNYALGLFQDGRKDDALPWLEKSVARDEKRTELVLGTMLFNGDSVTKDWVRAYALVTRSSQQGLPQASQTLAQMDQYIPEAQRQQGLTQARELEMKARAVAVAALPPAPAAKKTAATVPPAPKPVPVRPATPPKPAPVAAGGQWRIQLGAFRDEGNARALWGKVGAKTGGAASYVKAGAVTKLQATGFATRAAAQAACNKAGVSCVIVAP